jgi:hypothetical protein
VGRPKAADNDDNDDDDDDDDDDGGEDINMPTHAPAVMCP